MVGTYADMRVYLLALDLQRSQRVGVSSFEACLLLELTSRTHVPASLKHFEYVASLPSSSTLRTPLHFTDDEMTLLAGTNLHGATVDRRTTLHEEHAIVQQVVKLKGLTW